MVPPISPFSLPAKLVGLYPNPCLTFLTILGTTRLLCPSHPGSVSNDAVLRTAFGGSAPAASATASVTGKTHIMPHDARARVGRCVRIMARPLFVVVIPVDTP